MEGEDEDHIEPNLVFQMYCEYGRFRFVAVSCVFVEGTEICFFSLYKLRKYAGSLG